MLTIIALTILAMAVAGLYLLRLCDLQELKRSIAEVAAQREAIRAELTSYIAKVRDEQRKINAVFPRTLKIKHWKDTQ